MLDTTRPKLDSPYTAGSVFRYAALTDPSCAAHHLIREHMFSGDEVLRAGPEFYSAAEEMVSVATEGMGQQDIFWQSAESLAACSDDDSVDSDNPIHRVLCIKHVRWRAVV